MYKVKLKKNTYFTISTNNQKGQKGLLKGIYKLYKSSKLYFKDTNKTYLKLFVSLKTKHSNLFEVLKEIMKILLPLEVDKNKNPVFLKQKININFDNLSLFNVKIVTVGTSDKKNYWFTKDRDINNNPLESKFFLELEVNYNNISISEVK